MAKTLKYKHQNRVWWDRDGDIWFWDTMSDDWRVLSLRFDGGEIVDPANLHHPARAYGPFEAVKR